VRGPLTHPREGKDFVFLLASMSIGTPIDRVGSGDFGVTRRGRTGVVSLQTKVVVERRQF